MYIVCVHVYVRCVSLSVCVHITMAWGRDDIAATHSNGATISTVVVCVQDHDSIPILDKQNTVTEQKRREGIRLW